MNQQTASSQGTLKRTYKAEVVGNVGACQHLQLGPRHMIQSGQSESKMYNAVALTRIEQGQKQIMYLFVILSSGPKEILRSMRQNVQSKQESMKLQS